MATELANALRAWRDRVQPQEVGIPPGGVRRSPGLRREELASLAGVSVDYLVRLEQGRSTNPSAQVLSAIARALRLTVAERDELYRAAGVSAPSSGLVPTHVGPGLQRVLDRLGDTPVSVFTAAWDIVTWNPLWSALFCEPDTRNLAERHFLTEERLVVRSPEENETFSRELVADLRSASMTYPGDAALVQLVSTLRAQSEEFAALWEEYPVRSRVADRKTINSPAVGLITLDCDILMSAESDLRIVVYTATPGTVDAEKLDLLRVVGTQVLI